MEYERYRDWSKRKEYIRRWKEANKEKVAAYRKAYYEVRKGDYWRTKYYKYKPKNPDLYDHHWTPRDTTKSDIINPSSVRRNGKGVLKIVEERGKKCEHCGTTEKLLIHHKDGQGNNFYKRGLKPNNDPSNLLILCKSCHGKIHGQHAHKEHGISYIDFKERI